MPLKDTGISKDEQGDLRQKLRAAQTGGAAKSLQNVQISKDEQDDLRRKPALAPQKAAPTPAAPVKADAPKILVEYTIASGDSLTKIAQKFYGSAANWQALYEANKETIGDNPALIRPGQILQIPNLPKN